VRRVKLQEKGRDEDGERSANTRRYHGEGEIRRGARQR
jgi:hypothetical protein